MTKRIVDAPSLNRFSKALAYEQNRLLLDWLSDDAHRADLYRQILGEGGCLTFPSRDAAPRECDCDCEGLEHPRKQPKFGHKNVTLIADWPQIKKILEDNGSAYSNRVYAELGGGSFMLALDPTATAVHRLQREAFGTCFAYDRGQMIGLAHKACQAASIMSMRAPDFDLAVFAEQAALRFCQSMLGYSLADYRLLEASLRAAYRALVYQVLGRHFATDPMAIPEAKQAMGRLLARTSQLIDAYATQDENHDALKGCKEAALFPGLKPAMQALGEHPGEMNGEQRAIVAIGAAIGSVGNVQAAACTAVQALFADSDLWTTARHLVAEEMTARPTDKLDAWWGLIAAALRKNPPIPFLPRLRVDKAEDALADGEVILCLGGATLDTACPDALIWGLPRSGTHWCVGMELARPLIVEIVRQVMALPGLAECLDREDATVIGLKRRWGFACESYPLTHRRDSRVVQASLNVAMRLKPPARDSADRVREVIRSGAPRIESALREARHVHFAWFELIEADTVLVLHTVYDGPFEAYIQHFALKVGAIFDALFECIEDPPPMPVDKFPNEFVAHIQRHNRNPAMGYFFSAYPRRDVARILRDEWATP